MKKILSILLALTFCLGAFVSCGNEENSTESQDSSRNEYSNASSVNENEHNSNNFLYKMDGEFLTIDINNYGVAIDSSIYKSGNAWVLDSYESLIGFFEDNFEEYDLTSVNSSIFDNSYLIVVCGYKYDGYGIRKYSDLKIYNNNEIEIKKDHIETDYFSNLGSKLTLDFIVIPDAIPEALKTIINKKTNAKLLCSAFSEGLTEPNIIDFPSHEITTQPTKNGIAVKTFDKLEAFFAQNTTLVKLPSEVDLYFNGLIGAVIICNNVENGKYSDLRYIEGETNGDLYVEISPLYTTGEKEQLHIIFVPIVFLDGLNESRVLYIRENGIEKMNYVLVSND